MISRIAFRNFVTMMAVVVSSQQPSSYVNAFNQPSKIPLSPTPPPLVDITDGQLKAATVDSSSDGGVGRLVVGKDGGDDNDASLWSSLTEMIHSKIEDATQEAGGTDLSEEAKDEIIATAVAGSVLGTAVGSPLLIGAALGYAGSQMFQGTDQGDKARHALGQASRTAIEQANSAIVFTKNELENEKDLSKVSKKILLAIQEKADTVQMELTKKSPTGLMNELKDNVMKTVESEDFKTLPQRSLFAVREFLDSDEVKNVSSKAMKAIKDGLESDDMKALKNRASQSLKNTIDTQEK